MKRLITSLLILFVGASVQAQDIIVKNDGTEIRADVKEITVDDVIKYKNYDHLQGPVRNIRTRKVFMIIYENGNREIFKKKEKQKTTKEKSAEQDSSQFPDLPPPSDPSEEDTTSTKQMPDLPSPSEPVGDDTSDSETISNKEQAKSEPAIEEEKTEEEPPSKGYTDIEDDSQASPTSSFDDDYFSISFGYGTPYGLTGVSLAYRFGAVALHGGYDVTGNSSYSAGLKIYAGKHYFFDVHYFKSSFKQFNPNPFFTSFSYNGASLQTGYEVPLGDVLALSSSVGIARYFDLKEFFWNYSGGLKIRF